MMGDNRVSGIIELKTNGEIQNAKGSFTYNLGRLKKEMIVGQDRVHGYKALPQVPFIEGEITDRGSLNLETFMDADDVTVTLSLANGKVIVLKEGVYAADGDGSTEEANIQARWEGMSCEEVR